MCWRGNRDLWSSCSYLPRPAACAAFVLAPSCPLFSGRSTPAAHSIRRLSRPVPTVPACSSASGFALSRRTSPMDVRFLLQEHNRATNGSLVLPRNTKADCLICMLFLVARCKELSGSKSSSSCLVSDWPRCRKHGEFPTKLSASLMLCYILRSSYGSGESIH